MLFRVRGTGRGESVSTGTDGTHFVREPVFVITHTQLHGDSLARNQGVGPSKSFAQYYFAKLLDGPNYFAKLLDGPNK